VRTTFVVLRGTLSGVRLKPATLRLQAQHSAIIHDHTK